jgi:hypothetical protein
VIGDAPLCDGLSTLSTVGYLSCRQDGTICCDFVDGTDMERTNPPHPENCRLILHTANQYAATKRLRQLEQLDDVEPRQLERQRAAAASERWHNKSDFDVRTGQPSTFGRTHQLLASASRKFIQAEKRLAKEDHRALQCSLADSDNVDKQAWFRIMPGYATRVEGDRVRMGDSVILESVRMPGTYIHGDEAEAIEGDQFEVNIASEPTRFVIVPVAKYRDQIRRLNCAWPVLGQRGGSRSRRGWPASSAKASGCLPAACCCLQACCGWRHTDHRRHTHNKPVRTHRPSAATGTGLPPDSACGAGAPPSSFAPAMAGAHQPRNLSGALKIMDLDDFIAPAQDCIVPLAPPGGGKARLDLGGEVPMENPTDRLQRGAIAIEGLPTSGWSQTRLVPGGEGAAAAPDKVQITLSDCLACSGCVTSAETVLMSQQSDGEFLRVMSQIRATRKGVGNGVDGGGGDALSSAPAVAIMTEPEAEPLVGGVPLPTPMTATPTGGTGPTPRAAVVSLSPQSRASLAVNYGLNAVQAHTQLTR